MNKKEYSFYCLKCRTIPLIEINPKQNQLNILTTCNCHKQYIKGDNFFKNYYKKISILKEGKGEINEKINKLIENYENNKEIYENNCKTIKENAILSLNMAIGKIEAFYQINNDINKKIDKIIRILINNYKSDPNSIINIKNIISNTQINKNYEKIMINCDNLTNLMNKVDIYFRNNYIIKENKLKLIYNLKETNTNKTILELNNNLLATQFNDNFIKIFNYKNNNEEIALKLENSINNLLTDESKRYLIALIGNNSIKFWDIKEIENILKENNEKYIKLFPSYEFEHKRKILELVFLEKKFLLGKDDKNIFIYEYNINKKNSEIIKESDINVKNIKVIKRNDKKFICGSDFNYLLLIECPEFNVIEKIKICNWEGISLYYEQINKDELIIGANYYLKIFNLKKNKITISKKIDFNIMCIKQLKDNTILIGGRCQIKRFCPKKMQELPELISLDEDDSDFYEDDDYAEFLNNILSTKKDEKDVISIKELSDGKIVIILKYEINIYGLENTIKL